MTQESYHTPSQPEAIDEAQPPAPVVVWSERTYKPWGVSSKKSRRRSKNARLKAMRDWKRRRQDT